MSTLAVTNTIGNSNIPLNSNSKNSKTSIFYVNDIHGQVPKMERLHSAAQHSEVLAQQEKADFLKVCSGDTFIGSDEKRNLAAASFLNVMEMDAETLGNHEFDITASICGKLLGHSRTNILGMNLNFPNTTSELAKKVKRSTIVTGESGEKYGMIGIQPTDIAHRIKKKEALENITIDNDAQTIKELQEEVDKLEKQGINKIFLLSHAGNTLEKQIAKSVSGIDVILGGHSHDLIIGVKEGENLLYDPEGNPVIITQAGRDGSHFGVLNLEFNEKGQIVKVQNNVRDTNVYSPNVIMTKAMNNILGETPVIGKLSYVDPIPKNNLTDENPWADFVCDALINKLDAEISLINAANFRGSVDKGIVTERDITSIFPFNNTLYKVRLNEKDLVDAIKHCAKSMTTKNHKPGLLQVGGLSYTVNKQGKVLEISHKDKLGNINKIDVNNPNPNKFYTTVYDEFLVNGGDDMSMLKKSGTDIIQKYDFDKDIVTIDYIKTLNQPFEVRSDNRIKVVD